MTEALRIVVGVLVVAGGILFLGGMAAAAAEHYRDARQGKPLTFPGWRRSDRDAMRLDRDQYRVPGRTGWVLWPLVAVGRADLAQRYLERRSARRDQRASV